MLTREMFMSCCRVAGNSIVAMSFSRMTIVGSAHNMNSTQVFFEALNRGWIKKTEGGYDTGC